MDLSARVLGQSVVAALYEKAAAPVLVIGSDVFRRADLARLKCFNFQAAANLSAVLKAIGVENTRDVFNRLRPEDLVVPRLGAISLAVLGAAFEKKRIGGSSPLESWYALHRSQDAKREFVTFDTLKAREAKRDAGETRDRKRRKRERRDQAHRVRVGRFTARQARTPA